MNYLAHLLLSGDEEETLMGNFCGDAIKGKSFSNYPTGWQVGVLLHRSIDEFTDTHPITKQGRERLYQNYHKYAGVVLDMIYDHFLVTHFNEFSSLNLDDFLKNTFVILKRNFEKMPKKMQFMTPRMIEGKWIKKYGTLEGIDHALTHMSKHTSFASNMENAVDDLKRYYEDFEKEFLLFFPELVKYSNERKSELTKEYNLN